MRIHKIDNELVFDLTSGDLKKISEMLFALESRIKEESVLKVAVNLEGIESIYSLQIGTLAAMHVLCYENLAVMRLMNVHAHVKKQLELVGLDKLMELHHGPKVAKDSFK